MESQIIASISIAAVIGLASGAIGSFIILRRMALVGDALSHVALPGIALAFSWNINPFWGVLAFLAGAAFLMWWLEKKTNLHTDAIVGLLFTASLAFGVLFIPDAELLESLFGKFPRLSWFEFSFIAVLAFAIIVSVAACAKRFLFSTISPELALVEDHRRTADLLLFVIFAFTVALGIKFVGTLLMGALTVIPAAIAKNMPRSAVGYLAVSTLLGGAIAAGGAALAFRMHILPGPTIILIGVAIFLVTLAMRKS